MFCHRTIDCNIACVVNAINGVRWGYFLGEAFAYYSLWWQWQLQPCHSLPSLVVTIPQWWNPWCIAMTMSLSFAKQSFIIFTLMLHYPCSFVHLGNCGVATTMNVKLCAYFLLLNSFLIIKLCPIYSMILRPSSTSLEVGILIPTPPLPWSFLIPMDLLGENN